MIALASYAIGLSPDAMSTSVTVTGSFGCDRTCYDVDIREYPVYPDDPGGPGDGGDGGSGGDGDEDAPVCKPETPQGVDKMSDALAVKAAAEIRAQSEFKKREYGFLIYKDPAGTIRLSSIVTGTATSTTFNFTTMNIPASWVVGVVHNHPSEIYDNSPQEALANRNPSPGDWRTADALVSQAGVDSMTLQLYVLGTDNQLREYAHHLKETYIPDISPRGVIMTLGTSVPSDLVAPACP